MGEAPRVEITRILVDLRHQGADRAAITNQLFDGIYRELRRIAASMMRRERSGHTLQATALVHEAYLRLIDDTGIQWEDRAHFFGIAASAMRQILVQHARRRGAAKRGGGWARVTLDDQIGAAPPSEVRVLDLDRALTGLAEMDGRMARVVELRVFGGLEVKEVAQVLDVSERTIAGDWRMAKAWLARELSGESSSGPRAGDQAGAGSVGGPS